MSAYFSHSITRWIALDYSGTISHRSPRLQWHVLTELLNAALDRSVEPQGVTLLYFIEEQRRRSFETGIQKPLSEEIFRFIGDSSAEARRVVEDVLQDFFNRSEDGRPFQGISEVLRKVRASGYKLVLASNTEKPLSIRKRTLVQVGLENFFDVILLSSEVGYRKPHPEFYRAVLSSCNTAPENIVFVGDTIAKDVIGPSDAGMRSILVGSAQQSGIPTNLSGFIGTIDTVLKLPFILDHYQWNT